MLLLVYVAVFAGLANEDSMRCLQNDEEQGNGLVGQKQRNEAILAVLQVEREVLIRLRN